MNAVKRGDRASSLVDPRRTERVGIELAQDLLGRGTNTNVVVCWDSNEDVVLGHVVARELGAKLQLACEVEGIVELRESLLPAAAVVLVAEELAPANPLTPANPVAGLSGVVHHAGGRIVAVATAGEPAAVAGTRAEQALVLTAGGSRE